jgi:hypothetical protein
MKKKAIKQLVKAASLAPGEGLQATFTLEVPDADDAIGQENLWVSYQAQREGQSIGGENYTWFEVVPPVTVGFKPMFDIANYREFARETNTEWLIPTLATRVPLTVGQENPVTIEIANAGEAPASGQLAFDLPEGITVEGEHGFEVPTNETVEVTVNFAVDPAALCRQISTQPPSPAR